jgi:phage tail P2-like protein
MSASILPANLADLERDLDAALSRIELVEIPISVLWDPWQCPLDVLPYLAWAVSVDMWRTDWSEQTKRRVVAGSLDLHRIKGTRPAVLKALESIGLNVELTEWFEASPKAQPGTFSLVAWANSNLSQGQAGVLNDVVYEQVFAVVNNAKNTRSHYTFKAGAKFGPNHFGVGSAIRSAGVTRHDAVVSQQPFHGRGNLIAGAAMGSVGLMRHSVQPGVDALQTGTAIHVGGACSAVAVFCVSMEVKG